VSIPVVGKMEELNQVIQEQASLIESLKADKSGLEQSLSSLETDRECIKKENQILGKAVTIQQRRRLQADREVETVKAQADERIGALEQIIHSLRYRFQTQQNNFGNDFMHQRPPDVY
jgi:septal ring factor EnvC (AmiA/AmiB activator)